MAKKKVFISFRFSDGESIKEKVAEKLEEKGIIINKSEDKDRSDMTDETIKKYLYEKIGDSSITIVILTPKAINYSKKSNVIDDWLYDELRYSLEDREGNRTSGAIALYTDEAKDSLIEEKDDTTIIKDFDNLVRKNMFNVKSSYKQNQEENSYDRNYDHYISLISVTSFLSNPEKYLDICSEKRDNLDHYNIVKKMN